MNLVELYIMLHLKYAGIEYSKMISKISGLPINEVNNEIRKLMNNGIIERDEGKVVKRKEARFKKSYEVHKHHTYYKLTDKGKHTLREMDEKWFKNYFENVGRIENKKFAKILAYFIGKHIGKPFKINMH